ncbi:hypothetical protein [Streptomyces carpinensis]|uniref:hypothetical protein n=1 Tax=Streptomyces carpinensis TaxID=66369 RepID=UPI000A399DED|nr:hypothetical protein [Streptomyces carpinensis]
MRGGLDRIRTAEDVRHGRQGESFVVEACDGGAGTRVTGAGRDRREPRPAAARPVAARRRRLRVTPARATLHIAEFGRYRSADLTGTRAAGPRDVGEPVAPPRLPGAALRPATVRAAAHRV